MKVVLPFYSYLDSRKSPLFIKIARTLKDKYHMDIIAVTFGVHANKFIQEHPEVQLSAVYDIYDYISNNIQKTQKMTYDELSSIEDNYGMPLLWTYVIAAEPAFQGLSEKRSIEIVVTQIKFWESLFSAEKPDAFIDEGVGGLIMPVYKVASEHGCRILNMMTSRIPNRFIIHNNVFDHWENTEKIYQSMKKRELTLEEQERAKEFIEKFLSGKLKPPYMIYTTRSPTLTLKAPLTFIKYTKEYHEEKKTAIFSSADSPYNLATGYLTRIYRHKLLTNLIKVWENPVEGERYFLYPLQYQPENSTKILAPYYLNQIALIENISKSLPIGTKLYVREHPSSIGTRPLSYYKSVKAIPNVRLITPFIESYELIKRSLAVVTITSTMGWEAILFKKPLILLGRPYYHIYDLAYKINDVSELPIVMKQAIDGDRWDEQLIYKLVLAVIDSTYEGEINFDMPWALLDENVENLCKGIATELGLT